MKYYIDTSDGQLFRVAHDSDEFTETRTLNRHSEYGKWHESSFEVIDMAPEVHGFKRCNEYGHIIAVDEPVAKQVDYDEPVSEAEYMDVKESLSIPVAAVAPAYAANLLTVAPMGYRHNFKWSI